MDDGPLRKHLLEYRRTGDPTHVAALFEATAPQLWQLAMHLAPVPADADDLLQSTYLAVIQSVDRYDESQPAIGWMVGILTNQARAQKRRDGRWTNPDRLLEKLPSTPVEAAQSEEEKTLVNEAIASLPQLYKQVLELVVEKGIGPGEIAARLSRTPGTVRVQLHRAISLLRRNLPASIALPVALVSVQSIGLESVRRSIHQAAIKKGAGLGTVALGSKIAATVLGIATLGVTGWAVVDGNSPEETTLAAAPQETLAHPSGGTENDESATGSATVPGPASPSGRRGQRSDHSSTPEAVVEKPTEPPISFELVLHRGDGIDVETQAVVPARRADVSVPRSITRIEAQDGTHLARVPELDTDSELRGLGYTVGQVLGDEGLSGSADTILRSVVGFHPPSLKWTESLRIKYDEPRESVFFVQSRGGYAVIALVNTRWNPKLRKDEALVRGVFSSGEPIFSKPAKVTVDNGGVRFDLAAFGEDPWGDSLARERAAQLSELDARVALCSGVSPDTRSKVRGILNRRFARTVSDDGAYAAATFSFDHDTRDDVSVTRNDWSIQLQSNDSLDFRMVTDDRSLAWKIPGGWVDPMPHPLEMGTGEERFSQFQVNDLFLIHTLDSDTDRWDLLRILEREKGQWIIFEWTPFDDQDWIDRYREMVAGSVRRIENNRIFVQMRTGAGGGNPVRVFLNETHNTYLDEIVQHELDLFSRTIDSHDPARAYVEGGDVPPGKVFEIFQVEWQATTAGDSNGPGGFRIELAGERIVDVEESSQLTSGRWMGELPLGAGDSAKAFVELRNSSECEVTFHGNWRDAPLEGTGTDR